MGPFPHSAPRATISAANPAGTDGFEFVEFAHPDPEALRAPLLAACEDAGVKGTLLIAREDRALPLRERLALRLHMAMCQACPRFERQLLTMRNAMGRWRHYEDRPDEG